MLRMPLVEVRDEGSRRRRIARVPTKSSAVCALLAVARSGAYWPLGAARSHVEAVLRAWRDRGRKLGEDLPHPT